MNASGQVVQYTDDTRSFVTRQIAGETLIMPVAGRVADLESIYVLNEVASRIWQLSVRRPPRIKLPRPWRASSTCRPSARPKTSPSSSAPWTRAG